MDKKDVTNLITEIMRDINPKVSVLSIVARAHEIGDLIVNLSGGSAKLQDVGIEECAEFLSKYQDPSNPQVIDNLKKHLQNLLTHKETPKMMLVMCTLDNGVKKVVNIPNNPSFSTFINELKKALNIRNIQISYTDHYDQLPIENQNDLNDAINKFRGDLSINVTERQVSAPPKTAPKCREFQKTGTCKFGSNCHYSHEIKEDVFEYNPFRNNHAIVLFLEKKIDERPGPLQLSTRICKLQLEDVLSRENLSVDAVDRVLELFTGSELRKSVLKEETNKIYNHLLHSNFMERLQIYLSQEVPRIKKSTPVIDVVLLFRELLQRFPADYKKVPIKSLISCSQEMQRILEEDVLDEILYLEDLWNEQKDLETKPKEVEISYKNVPLFPTREEFNFQEKLPVNLAKGKFASGMQYLDVQYRLLREDCIRPLRDGIKSLVANQKPSDLKVYQNIQVCGLQCHPRLGVIYQISFSSKFKINFARSKRLIPGSLLCISSDNFNTQLWATVADRKVEDLEQNKISIRFANGFEPTFKIGVVYEMAESSSAYFEAYRHVLKGLQDMDPLNIPFSKYFVNVETNISAPKYIEKVDFSCVFPNKKWNPITEPWPAIESTLDRSQMDSLKLALTKEIALIQGPPGTGKTFVGLTIAKLLLSNYGKSRGPLLVICYTNHALDQFLESIYQFEKNIVRVGGRSQSELMKQIEKAMPRESTNESKRIYGVKKTMEEIEAKIKEAIDKLNEKLTIDHLQGIAEDQQIEELRKATTGNSLDFWIVKENNNEEEEKGSVNVEKKEVSLEDEMDEQEMKELQEDIQMIEQVKEIGKKTMEIKVVEDISIQGIDEEDFKYARNMLNMPETQRLMFLNYWTYKYREQNKRKLQTLCNEYESLSRTFREISSSLQLQLLQQAAVIGMTTTCAARNHDLLVALGAKVVLVEEAAEILESHILTSLTPSTEHLILIGDHLQLRPAIAVDSLGKNNNLNVSLFERLVNNGIEHTTLSRQRRMRPEFSRLIAKLYPNLQSHESVSKYPNVKGMTNNLYFFNHKNPETHSNDIKSYSNEFEADFVVKLAKHLLNQGYAPQNITILTTYVGQLLKLKEKRQGINGVRICTVDNYQGEENDIVLLSLVRSNKERKAGFIKVDNRACVALSRAKMGFYVVGDFDMFASVSSFWKIVLEEVRHQKAIGNSISLVNAGKTTIVKTISDFNKV